MDKEEIEEKLKELYEIGEKNKRHRGHIINKIIFEEKILTSILSICQSENKEEYKANYDRILLNDSLNNKIKSFEELNLHNMKEFKDKYIKLPDNLHEARNIRNKAAHNSENQINRELKIKLLHNSINGANEVVVNDDFIEWFDEIMKKIHSDLLEIIGEYKPLMNGLSKYIFGS